MAAGVIGAHGVHAPDHVEWELNFEVESATTLRMYFIVVIIISKLFKLIIFETP